MRRGRIGQGRIDGRAIRQGRIEQRRVDGRVIDRGSIEQGRKARGRVNEENLKGG